MFFLLLALILNILYPTKNVFAGEIEVGISGNKLTVETKGIQGAKDAWNDFLEKYKNFIVGIAGVGAVTMVALFIRQFVKLGSSADNPVEREQALQGVLWTGIAAAGLGAVAVVTGFFYHAFA